MSKAFELEGTLKEVMETKTFPSGFTKREFVVTEDDDRYPQDIKLSMVKGNCELRPPRHRQARRQGPRHLLPPRQPLPRPLLHRPPGLQA